MLLGVTGGKNVKHKDTLSLLIGLLVTLWFLYLAWKVAVHVHAWPFG